MTAAIQQGGYEPQVRTAPDVPLTKATAPQNALGYVQPYTGYWWLYENETTPELQWPQSVFVYDQMRRQDAQIKSVLQAVTLPILRTPWRIDPNGARDEVVQLVAQDLGLPIVGQPEDGTYPRGRDRFSWREHLREALGHLWAGYAYFEQVYRVDDNGKYAHLAKLSPRPQTTIEKVDVAQDGGLVQIWQRWSPRSRDEAIAIPVNRLVCYVNEKEGGNWFGKSLLRACYKNWVLKDRLLRVQAQTIERNGMGIPLYKGQDGASADDLTAGKAMASAWRSGETAGSAVPFGADIILKGVDGTLPDAGPAVEYHDAQIARAVLAHFLNLGTQTGSWALGSTFADFFTLSLQALADYMADTATCHVVEDLVDINFGPDEPAPRICFDEIGSRPDATAIAALLQSGAIVADDTLEAALRQQYGLPPKDESARPTPPSPGAPSATPAPQPQDYGQRSVAASGMDAEDDDREAEEYPFGLSDAEIEGVEALLWALESLDGRVLAASVPGELRQPKGHKGGGQFASRINTDILDALKKWLRGEGSDNPLTKPESGKAFSAAQLRSVIKQRGLPEPAKGLRATALERILLEDARAGHLTDRAEQIANKPNLPGAPSDHRRFSITHNGERIDVGIFGSPTTGKLSIYRESDHGVKSGRAIKSFDDIGGVATWARQQGHSDLASYAEAEAKRTGVNVPEAEVPAKAAGDAVDGHLATLLAGLRKVPDARRKDALGHPSLVSQIEGIRAKHANGELSVDQVQGLLQRFVIRHSVAGGDHAYTNRDERPAALLGEAAKAIRGEAPARAAKKAARGKPEVGDHVTWERSGEPTVHGTVMKKGNRLFVDWGTGRPEPLYQVVGGQGITFTRPTEQPSLAPAFAHDLFTPEGAANFGRGMDPTVPASRDVAHADAQRAISKTLAEIHQLRQDGASDKAMEARIRSNAKLIGLKPEVTDELVKAATGDRSGLDSTLQRIAKTAGVDAPNRDAEVEQAIRDAHAAIMANPNRRQHGLDTFGPSIGEIRQQLDQQRHEAEVENKIRAAYAAVLATHANKGAYGEHWVSLADLRDRLGESVNRTEADAALLKMSRGDSLHERGVRVIPVANLKALKQRDRDSALNINGEPVGHAISIEDPSPVPVPTYTKAEIDAALTRLSRQPGVNLLPEENQKVLTAQDRLDAVNVGGRDYHALQIEGTKAPEAGLASKKVVELRALAKGRGIKGFSRMNRDALLSALGG